MNNEGKTHSIYTWMDETDDRLSVIEHKLEKLTAMYETLDSIFSAKDEELVEISIDTDTELE